MRESSGLGCGANIPNCACGALVEQCALTSANEVPSGATRCYLLRKFENCAMHDHCGHASHEYDDF
jgi:hypothetical protein